MTLRRWWKQKSGGTKAVTALAVLLMLQIGLCFASGFAVDRLVAPTPGEEFGASMGWMYVQAILCLVTAALLVIAIIVAFVARVINSAKSGSRKDSND